jgi:phenylpropionate dioxygenase-like ring-hydroxylating dioxygenase large terminal subunit
MGAGVIEFKTSEIYAQLKNVVPPIDRAHTLPPACYTHADFYQQEMQAVFRSSWVGLGRADRWPSPGDYSAMDIAGVPTIVLRDKTGELRAFANSCRHRSMQLLEGEGNTKSITCPYHAWAYALEGNLMGAPTMQKTCNFDKSEYALHPFRVGTRDGLAFLNMDDEAGDLDQWLGDFSQLHAQWSMADLSTARRTEFEVECNWKSYLEVFNEYYHLPVVHPNSLDRMYDPPDDTDSVSGNYTTQFGTTQGTPALLGESKDSALPVIKTLCGGNRKGTRYTWVYPNLTFAASVESVWMFDVYPLSPGRCKVGMTICFTPEALALPDYESRAEKYFQRFDIALGEDLPVLEKQAIGLNSPFARPGRFSCLEPSIANFACWYAEKLR